MGKTMTAERAERCLAEAARSPFGDARVRYPAWYLQRWHFLPEGYLSRRSAAGYDRLVRNFYNATAERRLLATLVAKLAGQRPASVIDIGCGPGRALERVAQTLPDARLVGIDLSPFNLERAESRLATAAVELVHADALAVPFEGESFAAAVASHVIGHLPRDAARTVWDEVARLLEPGGRFYVADHRWHPEFEAPLRLLARGHVIGGLVRFSVFEKPAEAA